MAAEREVVSSDSYLERVKKLIPAEVSAAFLAINSLIPLHQTNNLYLLAFFGALLIICILYLRLLEKVGSWLQIAFVSVIAFPVWAVNIAIARIEWLDNKTFVPACILIIVTLLTPLLVRRP